ncbi:hypothetical protein ABK040_004461 [Willaertia magna]
MHSKKLTKILRLTIGNTTKKYVSGICTGLHTFKTNKLSHSSFTINSTTKFNSFSINLPSLESVEAEHIHNKSDLIIEANQSTFQSLIQSGEPIVIDFYADWCDPCKQIAPHLEKFTLKHKGLFKLVKLNVDNEPEVAQMFRVQSIPAVLFIMDRKLVNQFQGAVAEKDIEAHLDYFAKFITEQKQQGQPEQQKDTKEVDADSPEYLIGIASKLLEQGELDEATKVYNQILEKANQNDQSDFAVKSLSGLLSICLYQYKMEAAKHIVSQLKKDYAELIKEDKDVLTAIGLYEIYKEAGEELVKTLNQQVPLESLSSEKDKTLYLFLQGHHKEALDSGLNMLKKGGDIKTEGRKLLVLMLEVLDQNPQKKKLISDTRKRMANLLY